MTTSTDLEVRRPTGALAVTDGQTEWTPTQRAALAQIGVGNAPLADQLVLLHRAQTTGLDPFSRQIYMLERREKKAGQWIVKWGIQTGIDGFRVTARRAARRDGESYTYEDPLWCGPDGQWVDVWLGEGPPRAAKFVVVKTDAQGRKERFAPVAKWESYVQTNTDGIPTGRWRSGGDQMLSKCCEALALRMAYPHDLSGMYTDDEMAHKDRPVDVTGTAHVQHAGPTEQQRLDWVAEWGKRFEAATTLEQLGELGHGVRRAEETGHCLPDVAEELRQVLRTRAGGMPATDKHLTRVHAALGERGVTDRDDKLETLSRLVGRRLTSSSELTCAEADTVYDAVRNALDGTDLVTGEVQPEGTGVPLDGQVAP